MLNFKINFLLLLCIPHVLLKNEKHVRISLDAKWQQTPFAFEASEFLSVKSNEKYWEFINKFAGAKIGETDKDQYVFAIEQAAAILSPIEVNSLKFALSLRSYSPRVQLFQQIAALLKEKCNILYQVEEKEFCNLQDAFSFAKSFTDESKKEILLQDFDHVFPDSKNNQIVFMIYADFREKTFFESHENILKNLKELNLIYVFRPIFKPSHGKSKVTLSGYGVELSVKSTEYKAVDDQKVEDGKKKEKLSESDGDVEEIEGFLFKRLRELHPALRDDLEQYKKHLQESNKELAPLKVWQLQDLSFQAAQRIRSASNQDALKVLRDLSQNAPMVARSLVKTKVNEDLRSEVKENQQEFESMGVSPGASALYVNGIEMDVSDLNAHKLLDVVNNETGTMSDISKLKLEMSKTGSLLALNMRPKTDELILDTRSESVQFVNNLEKDSQYNYWPSSLNEILRPTFPGMMRYIAKNIFHIVAFVDPLSAEFYKILKKFDDLIDNSFPARFGFVFISSGKISDKPEHNAGAAMMRAFSFIKTDNGRDAAFNFLRKVHRKAGSKQPTSKDIIEYFTSLHGSSDAEEVLGQNSEYDDLRKTSYQKYISLGLKSHPQVLVNGEKLGENEIFGNIEQTLVEKVLTQTSAVQQAVYMGSHHSYPSIYDYLMSQPNVVSRINPLIQKVSGRYVDFNFGKTNNDISKYSQTEAVDHLVENARYFISDKGVTTVYVIANGNIDDGKFLLLNALKYVVKQKDVRLAVFLHGSSSNEKMTLNTILQIVLNFREKLISGIAKLLIKVLESEANVENLAENELVKLASGITGINKKKLQDALTLETNIEKVNVEISKNSNLVKTAFNIESDNDNIVVANGRVIGPLKGSDIFLKEDFDLLQDFENGRCGYKVTEIINKMTLPDMPVEGHERYKSDLVMAVISVLSKVDSEVKRTTFSYKDDQHSVIHLPARSNEIPSLDIDAILDPLSKDAQKLAAVLPVLHETFNANLKIFLNPKEKHSEMPVKRFYQYVLQSELHFSKDGHLIPDQVAMFGNLPHSALLTLIMDTPQNWLIEAVGANHDLDNIHLGQADDIVYGDFELENIIVQGSCSDANSHQHPRGLQFVLGTQTQPDMFDTIVMANLGYFQLKAFPGLFVLQLRDGRSAQIYQIHSLSGGGKVLNEGYNYTVAVDSFSGKFLKVKVKRQEGKENEDLLGGEGGEDDTDIFGIWSSLASYVKTPGKSTKSTTDGKIHIFSVATGLLYERFLRIMMLSVLKHTKTPVKFWFLKNYLSAGFTSFLPRYAETYGFEYELVQYQWPKWLNGQTEKQRIIWGYKILFLDVLFPLNLDRIIFVDADQIVRADLKELMDMDLESAPYAYTPFCNDRPEVEGFRFWNQGYWKNHLAGRPYHISALYVVDLKRFRRVAAGDRLRGQYQGLSQDPNSLANLDQDLPNNMIHQVQIKSLPQEWLWCETWCSDESKKRAKTIDMCNNPQTKEPKLTRAMRIAPEWIEYDEIIKKLMTSNTTIEKPDDMKKGHQDRVEL